MPLKSHLHHIDRKATTGMKHDRDFSMVNSNTLSLHERHATNHKSIALAQLRKDEGLSAIATTKFLFFAIIQRPYGWSMVPQNIGKNRTKIYYCHTYVYMYRMFTFVCIYVQCYQALDCSNVARILHLHNTFCCHVSFRSLILCT